MDLNTTSRHCYLELHACFNFICHDLRHYLIEEQKHLVCCLRLNLALINEVIKCIDKSGADAGYVLLLATLHEVAAEHSDIPRTAIQLEVGSSHPRRWFCSRCDGKGKN